MDPLSSALRVLRVDGTYFYPVDAHGAWKIVTTIDRRLRSHVLPGIEHLVPYHVVLEGECVGHVQGQPPVHLRPGDVIMFPQGDPHIMGSILHQRIGSPTIAPLPPRFPERGVVVGDAPMPETRFLCGFLGFDLRPFNPLLASLPRHIHVRQMPAGWIESLKHQLADSTGTPRPGAESVLTRLVELMFIEVVRRHLDALPADDTGWLAGVRDPMVGRALALIHERPEHPWTLIDLARAVASSRTRLSERFGELVGRPPMQYLAAWRMQVAAQRLRQGGTKVAALAREVGYESVAAFSRAFKKATGAAPAEWRDAPPSPRPPTAKRPPRRREGR